MSVIKISEQIKLDTEHGLYDYSGDQPVCIADNKGYVTRFFVCALRGELDTKFPLLIANKEWQSADIQSTFDSFSILRQYVSLSESKIVQEHLPSSAAPQLKTLFTLYLNWVITLEDDWVQRDPSIWFVSAFHPADVYADDGLDIYTIYDHIPFGGFARDYFYYSIAKTAKDIIRQVPLATDVLQAAKQAIEQCIHIFDELLAINIGFTQARPLAERYLSKALEEMKYQSSHHIDMSDDDLWQEILSREKKYYTFFEQHIVSSGYTTLRNLLTLQGDLIKRIETEHPYLNKADEAMWRNQLPPRSDYVRLAQWLEEQKRQGHDWVTQVGSVAALCNDTRFKRLIQWDIIHADSLRRAINRLNEK